MGTRGRGIVENADQIVKLLNKAYADEWLAYYQYWLGAKIVVGPMKDAVIAELVQHAADELRHADMLTNRIIQLGGTPVLTPKDWYDHSNCGYNSPEDPYVRRILEQNIEGEQCAIDVYDKLMKESRETDPITHNMVLQILEDEVEHEEDLQALAEDLDEMVKKEK